MKSYCSTVFFLGCLLLVAGLPAQGLLLDDAAYNRLPRLPNYGGKTSEALLRQTPKVDLRPFCPRPQHQGVIGSCTGWSTGYGAMSMLQAMENGWAGQVDTITKYARSALYLYNQIKIGSCHSGSYISRAAMLAKQEGSSYSSQFDWFKNDCERLPTEQDSLDALSFRIKDFVTLFGTNESDAAKLEKVRLSLLQKKPVVVGVLLRNNFQSCTAGSPYWEPENGDTTFMGAHAMVVVGYDDGREAFEVLNSWGEGWGNGGFAWIRYTDFARFCTYALQLIPRLDADAKTKTIPLRVSLSATEPYYDHEKNLRFRPDQYTLVEGCYQPLKQVKTAGSLSRWQLNNITPDSYLYAFSVGPDQRVNVHWPRAGALNDKFSGLNESAVITQADAGIFLPDEYGALRYGKPGEEYLCYLVSATPIDDLSKRLRTFRYRPGTDFKAALRKMLGSRLASSSRLAYASEEVGFSGALAEGEIAAIVIRIPVAQ